MASSMSNADVPKESGKSMCACMSCKLVKTYAQFVDRGCENCEWLHMEGDGTRVTDCTTVNFTGLIAIVDPAASWSAKWQHASKLKPGCYALDVQGAVPEHVDDLIHDRRRHYR
ncbi:hypothetical protein ABBQ32_012455 [Trebouxia sp. C0010 RCD-2024]